MKYAITFLTLFISCSAIAGPGVSEGPGPVATYATCSGQLLDGTKASFQIRSTAAFIVIDSVLMNTETNAMIAHLYCNPSQEDANHLPVANATWSCGDTSWDDNIDGGFLIQVSQSATGVKTAEISNKQIFPLPPQVEGTLTCK